MENEESLKNVYQVLLFEYNNFESKKYLSSELRLRMIRSRLPLEYVDEFNQLLIVLNRLEKESFDTEKMAFRAVIANISEDIAEEARSNKKGIAA